jgi:hypothetical protein
MENIDVIANLPSVLWKMINQKNASSKNTEAYDQLQNVLYLWP